MAGGQVSSRDEYQRLRNYVERVLFAKAADMGVSIPLEEASDAISKLFMVIVKCSITRARRGEQGKPLRINTEVLDDISDYVLRRLEDAGEDIISRIKRLAEELEEKVLSRCRAFLVPDALKTLRALEGGGDRP